MKTRICLLLSIGFILPTVACKDGHMSQVPAEKSKLKKATDVFWALDEMGYVVTKARPEPSRHGCIPNEYLAQKEIAEFRISVYHCGDYQRTKSIVENPKTRLVDSFLRNHHDGGILQRGPLEIIIRKTRGEKQAVQDLLDALEAL